jgi:hypothetical protein
VFRVADDGQPKGTDADAVAQISTTLANLGRDAFRGHRSRRFRKGTERTNRASMLRALALIVLSVSGGVAPCATGAHSSPAIASEAFDSYEKAARAALRMAMAISASSAYEYCGAVLAIEGRFYFTEPVSSESERECTARVLLPQGVSLAAIYHTHPQVVPMLETRALRNMRRYFSRLDQETARALNVPSFLGLRWSEEVVVFEPRRRPEGDRFTASTRR